MNVNRVLVGGWVVVVVTVCGWEEGEAGRLFELARCPHSICPSIPENMAKEEVAKPVVGNDSGTCKASFAGDVPRMFSLIKNEGDPPHQGTVAVFTINHAD